MTKWSRINYHPCLPMGADGRRITASSEHIALSRQAAADGMVLLKNDNNVLPFKYGTKLAVFGTAQIDYVKGGGGSGNVTVEYVRNIYDGLKLKADKVTVFEPLSAYYAEAVKKQLADGIEICRTEEVELPENLLLDARNFTDTAIITIGRFSGESWDRKGEKHDGDFYLNPAEEAMVNAVKKVFPKVVVTLNAGSMLDSDWFKEDDEISSVLLAWQAGMEGGAAIADLLVGDVTPSGKLVDTFARSMECYPSFENFNASVDYVEYTEDIFVGYRYFETIPEAFDKVNYPFGFGLSYTTFDINCTSVTENDNEITVSASVTNTGDFSGREVLQLYIEAPKGKLEKAKKVLCAFKKTRTLLPGETQVITLKFDITGFASYDDLGAVCKSAYILEGGDYLLHLGNSVRNTKALDYKYSVPEEYRLVRQLSQKCAPSKLTKRMRADGTYEKFPSFELVPPCESKSNDMLTASAPEEKAKLIDVVNGKVTMDEFIAQLTDDMLVDMVEGHHNRGIADTCGFGDLEEYGVPNVMTADGPAGLRIVADRGVCTTAWPTAVLLACTWDTDLMYKIGQAGAAEVKENNCGIWLTPALNIHRNPLCGRNFEYFSEDPLISGLMAAAKVNGIQSKNIAACVKHFACNNKERNRKKSDSILSERALREIYLKGFEIIMKESDPWSLMTSYNLVNGRYPSENKELLEGILREEWGFGGMVTTDWENFADPVCEIKAGNDVKMPYGYPEQLKEALKDGRLTRADLAACAKNILNMITKLD